MTDREKGTGWIFGLIRGICLALTAALWISGFLLTCYAEDMTGQKVLTEWDYPLIHAACVCVFLPAAWLIWKWVGKKPRRRKRILLGITLGWYLAAGALLIVFGRTVPAADSLSVFYAAQDMAAGGRDVILSRESYLSYYPQQVGLMAYFECIIRIWNLFPVSVPAYHLIKCLNAVWACVILCAQYKTVEVLFRDSRAQTLYLLLALFHFPFLMYTSFVYGEIPSMALFSVGLWIVTCRLGENPEQGSAVSKECVAPKECAASKGCAAPKGCRTAAGFLSAALCFGAAAALRKNTLILMIAVAAVLVVEAFSRRRPFLAALAGVCLLCSFGSLPAAEAYYEHRTGGELASGVTALSYVAMGMQESSRAEGWYNGFNFDTYRESGMNADLANQISRDAIRERLAYFREYPSYAAGFYGRKLLSQWADGTYASRQATLATFGGRSGFFQQLYEGRYSVAYIRVCNLFQNLLYMGAFLFCLASLRKKPKSAGPAEGLWQYIGLIGVLGGFLFHIFWEANARYIFPYSLLLLPYAARGWSLMLERRKS